MRHVSFPERACAHAAAIIFEPGGGSYSSNDNATSLDLDSLIYALIKSAEILKEMRLRVMVSKLGEPLCYLMGVKRFLRPSVCVRSETHTEAPWFYGHRMMLAQLNQTNQQMPI